MNETWEQWQPPIKIIYPNYSTYSITNYFDDLKIYLISANNEQKIEIFFDWLIYGYRITNKNLRQATLSKLSEKYESKFHSKWTFFQVTNSSYLKWLNKESGTIAEHYNLKHYAFITTNMFIDILAPKDPKITLIKIK